MSHEPARLQPLETNSSLQNINLLAASEHSEEFQELINSLPSNDSWHGLSLHYYQGYWMNTKHMKGQFSWHKYYQPRPSDILLASFPKSGTTWLKALAFTIVKRSEFPDLKQHPVLSSHPHDLMPWIEDDENFETISSRLEKLRNPRLIATHMPPSLLPRSVFESGCKIVYIWRDPKDTFISLWKFMNKLMDSELSLEEAFDLFCKGICWFGSLWDHVAAYWKESLENPDKVLFLKYEKLKEDTHNEVRKLSEFCGCPFTVEEEAVGLVEEIVKSCSFDHLKNLDVNKHGKWEAGYPNEAFFRNGKVGDAANHLSPEQVRFIDEITAEKFTGLQLIA